MCDTAPANQPSPVTDQDQRSHRPDNGGPRRPTAWIHAAILFAGALGLTLLSAWIPLIDPEDGRFILRAMDDQRTIATLSTTLVSAAAAVGGLGILLALWTLCRDPHVRSAWQWTTNWLAGHRAYTLLIALSVTLGAVDYYELFYDPFTREHGLRIWMLREDLQLWLQWAAVLVAAAAMWVLAPSPDRVQHAARALRTSLVRHHKIWMLFAAGVPMVAAAAMCRWALDGIPHFSDSLTYLIQGRILHTGHVAINAPKHPELLTHSLFFLSVDGRYFGKYPPGWPAILGAFDRAGLLFMANATLAALATVLTGLVARQFTPRRVAVIAALLFGLSPWLWFHGAGFASHVASTCAVLAFLWLFMVALRTNATPAALGAGLALGAAVLIRPFDAAMFALPAVFMVLWRQLRDPKRWLLLGSLIAAAALVGVGVYMAVNAHTTGAALKSPYALESRWDSDWNPSPLSMLARTAFQIAELNGRFPGWGFGGITLAVIGAIAAGPRWRQPGLRLLTLSSALFFFGSTVFVFTNVWWGPRWLLPATPLLAILAAELVDRIICTIPISQQQPGPSVAIRSAAQLAACILASGLLIGSATRYAARFYQHTIMPPHQVSAQAHRRVIARLAADVSGPAIVAMPPVGTRAPLDARAGIVFMDMPIELNPVIYVRAIENWPELAAKSFPNRTMYEIVPDQKTDNGFVINKLEL